MNEYIFHGYTVKDNGIVLGKKNEPLKTEKRARRGGGYCVCVRLYINKKMTKFTLHRLVAMCFLGPIYGYEVNHKDRNTDNNDVSNLEIVTRKENQQHWRNDVREK